MKIGQFGNQFKSISSIRYSDYKSMLDYDAFIIDSNYVTEEFCPNQYDLNKITLLGDSENLKNTIQRRHSNIIEFISLNKPVIWFVPMPQEIYYQNRYVSFHIDKELTIGLVTRRHEGSAIDVVKQTRFTNFFEKYKEAFLYIAEVESEVDTPILKIKGTSKVVSFVQENIIFIPRIIKDKLSVSEEKIFLTELIELIINKPEEIILPEWHSEYFLPNEKVKNQKLIQLNNQLEEIKCEIQKEEVEINELEKFKLLFTGTGTSLEKQVEKIFTDLGCETLVVEKDRDDLILKWNDKVAVIEVKGVNGSSAEKYARQLEQWVAQKEESVKGILITNGFKDFKLEERKQDVFPDQMLKYSKQREHCLISGLQLLGLYFDCLKNPSLKEEKLQSLFDTVGVY